MQTQKCRVKYTLQLTSPYAPLTQAYRSLHLCKSAVFTHVGCKGVPHSPLQAVCSHQWLHRPQVPGVYICEGAMHG